MSRYILVDRGSGSRAGQLLRHRDDPYRWLIRVNLGKDATGKRRTISKVIHGTRRVAEAALIEMLQRKGDGRLVPRSSVTLAQAVEDWQKRKAKQVRPRTMQDYEERLRTYVLPVLGHRRLADLRLWDINNLYGDMEAGTLPDACRDAGWKGGPLSARSVRITHTALTHSPKSGKRTYAGSCTT